jgi:hypothetical protein
MSQFSKVLNKFTTQTGYRVTQENWTLYDGVPTSSPLTLAIAPTVSFRCRVAISVVTGHADVTGTLTVGTETLTFNSAGTKTTTVSLSAKPVVTYTNLDCHILIEAISPSGANLQQETQILIDCRFNNTQKTFQNSLGIWNTTSAIAYTNDSDISIGDTFSHGNYDYQIAQISSHNDLSNTEIFRKLWLTGKTLAPTGRITVTDDYMKKATYDIDKDGIVDIAEGMPEVTDFPTSPKKGDFVFKGGKVYVCTES